jgi:zinc transporter, ZIP family
LAAASRFATTGPGGSILYVVIELLAVARKANLKTITTWGTCAGLIRGFATDAITAAGA